MPPLRRHTRVLVSPAGIGGATALVVRAERVRVGQRAFRDNSLIQVVLQNGQIRPEKFASLHTLR